jgi:protein-L-isoaspartate(D-aspartate) O-methyltransferase
MKQDPFAHLRRQMVQYQIASRGVTDERVLQAMRDVPRHRFVPLDYQDQAYDDHPLPIGSGQTISQPYIVAFMTEQLALRGDEIVLEVGTGSGYQAAVLARLVRLVHTVERVAELAERAEGIFRELKLTNIKVHVGDGSLGWPPDSPYQAILVTAAAPACPPALQEQLDLGGRMIIPVGERFHQTLELWQRDEYGLHCQDILPVMFVPLKGEQGWSPGDPQL